jgi:hypothetical protein
MDSDSLTGFAEYLVWQQEGQVCGTILSQLNFSSTMFGPSIVYKTDIEPDANRVHLYFSDSSRSAINDKVNTRYTERHTKRAFLSACYHAMTRLREGGHFVCSILDTFTRFTAGLVYLLYRSFKSITIIRPFTVDPASPKRFLVCQALTTPVEARHIIQHLQKLMEQDQVEDILEVVPFESLVQSEFQQYMANTTLRLLQREIQALSKRIYLLDTNGSEQVCLWIILWCLYLSSRHL